MKRSNEFAVGLAVLAALALVIGGALWLSETDVNQKEATYTARFRTVGGLGVGAPVTLRGVRVGRVEAIRLAPEDWVEAELTVDRSVELPAKPAVISASASLFGEWSANIVSFEPLPSDPIVRNALVESDLAGGEALARRHPPRHRPAHRAGEPHRGRRRRHHRPHRPGVRQHRPQGPAAEREGPGRDLPADGEVRRRADQPHRPREQQRGHHVGRIRRRGADVPAGGGPARHRDGRRAAGGHPRQRPGLERRPATGGRGHALGDGARPGPTRRASCG